MSFFLWYNKDNLKWKRGIKVSEELINKLKEKGHHAKMDSSNGFTGITFRIEEKKDYFRFIQGNIADTLFFFSNVVKNTGREALEIILNHFTLSKKPLIIRMMSENTMSEMVDFFDEKEYEKINEHSAKEIKHYFIEDMMSRITKEHVKKLVEIARVVHFIFHYLKKWQEKELLVSVFFERFNEYKCYNSGKMGKINLIIENEKKILRINDQEKVVENQQDIEKFIEKWIKETAKKQRIRSITHPYMYFFRNWIDKETRLQVIQEELYQKLLTEFTAFEIEQIAATCVKKEEAYQKIDQEHLIIYFKEKVIVISMNPFDVFVFTKSEQVKEKIISCLVQQRENYLQQKFKNFC